MSYRDEFEQYRDDALEQIKQLETAQEKGW